MNRLRWLLLVFCLLAAVSIAQGVDFTFAVWSDTHFGANDGGGYRDNSAQDILTLPGTPYPPQIGGVVGPIAFVLHTGDITDQTAFSSYQDNDGMTDDDFISCINRWFTPSRIPVYEITGNHDSYNEPGATQIRQAIAGRHGATSYSFDYGGVHFIGLDGWTTSDQALHSTALSFLEAHMPTVNTQQAVIIFNHYTPRDPPHAVWDRVYNAIKSHNVILMCEGHEHYPRAGKWRGFDYFVTSDCKVIHGNQGFSVVRITDTELTAIARDWNTNTWHTDAILRKPISGVTPSFSKKIVNPSFEDNGGSHDGWQIYRVPGKEGPDTPPLSNSNSYGVRTPFGNRFAGKITSWMGMDFTMGQVIEVWDYNPSDSDIDWAFSAYVQMHSRTGLTPYPDNVHQVWEIGWNTDGTPPLNINDCDVYRTIANIDGTFTGNDAKNFYRLSASGTISGVTGLRYVALRVRMYNDAGREWSMNNIDNISLELTSCNGTNISAAKQLANGAQVSLCSKPVIGVFGDTFYIEEPDRSTGIRVVKSGHGLSVGAKANVTGTIMTNSDGERYIAATNVASHWVQTLRPVLAINREVGGADWQYNSGTGAGQSGVRFGSGANNIGLLITTSGRVTFVGSGYFYIDDGSALNDGSGQRGIKVMTSSLTSPTVGQYVTVTGISSCFKSGNDLQRLILATNITTSQ